MHHKNNEEPKWQHHAYDFFTGGNTKTGDLAIYYNVAFDNIVKINRQINAWTETRKEYFLAEYLWKVHRQKRNSDGYELTRDDRKMIPTIVKKLEALRNYHSHTWHDNNELRFEEWTVKFIEQKFNEAKAQISIDYPSAMADYEWLEQKNPKAKLFKQVKGNCYITEEGRIFLLSFFLSTGEMSHLLQQRKGSKRTDMPLYKMKRLIYTFYCHRDGASIADFNHEERFIDSLDAKQKQDILKARTAFKLINYLLDYPEYWGSRDAMPLFATDGEQINNAIQLKTYLVEHPDILPNLGFEQVERKHKGDEAEKKEADNKYRTGTLAVTTDELPDYEFHISFDDLHRLVLLQLLYKQQNKEAEVLAAEDEEQRSSPVDIFKRSLRAEAEKRSALYKILFNGDKKRDNDDLYFLFDKKNQLLRGSRKLMERGITFFENLEKGRAEDEGNVEELLAMLRKKGVPCDKDEIEPEPIQMYRQDFVHTTTQKFRAGNRFVFYTSKFLIDFGEAEWYWGMESFNTEKPESKTGKETLLKNKTYLKAAEIPLHKDSRLTLENDHVYWAYPKTTGKGTLNHEQFHQFAVGQKAMRYLAAFIRENEGSFKQEMNSFLQTLSCDLEKLQRQGEWSEGDGYSLLESSFVPEYLKPAIRDAAWLRVQVEARIKYITAEWQKALTNLHYLSRSEKNKLVMDAYRLFDWTNGKDEVKFLRANEYNQLSVCHYSLHLDDKKKVRPRNGKHGSKKPRQFDYLFRLLFKLDTRKPSLPKEVIVLLEQSRSLDELLVNVIERQRFFLRSAVEQLKGLPGKQYKERLIIFSRRLGISIPVSVLKEADKQSLVKKHKVTAAVQPFPIHPMLVVKHFFKDQYLAGKKMETSMTASGSVVRKRPALQIFDTVRRNKKLGDVLYPLFYEDEITRLFYPQAAAIKQKEKLKGLINTTYTEDILLWWMAQRYLKNEYTRPLHELVTGNKVRLGKYHLGKLHSLTIPLPLKREPEEIEQNITSRHPDILYANVLMHQLDDLMFLTRKSRLRKAAIHFRNRCDYEKDLWQQDIKLMTDNQFEGRTLPDGTLNNPFPFRLLMDEVELVRRTGQGFANKIFALERAILDVLLTKSFGGNKDKFQEWLLEQYTNGDYDHAKSIPYMKFEQILALAGNAGNNIGDDDKKLLSALRNLALHNDIPLTGSFSWVTREKEPLRQSLGITENLHQKKDRTMYMKDAEGE